MERNRARTAIDEERIIEDIEEVTQRQGKGTLNAGPIQLALFYHRSLFLSQLGHKKGPSLMATSCEKKLWPKAEESSRSGTAH